VYMYVDTYLSAWRNTVLETVSS